jgi:hypothetical protein
MAATGARGALSRRWCQGVRGVAVVSVPRMRSAVDILSSRFDVVSI